MKMQRFAENYYAALPVALICIFLPILNWFSLTWAVFTVLRQNIYVGAISITVIGFACFYVFGGLHLHGTFQELFSIMTFIGPLWLMAYSLRIFRSLNWSLQAGFLLLALMTLVSYGVYGVVSYDELYQALDNRLFGGEAGTNQALGTMQQTYLTIMVETILFAWPSMMFLMQVLLLLCARYFQSRWYYPGGFQMEFHALRLSRLMIVPLLLSFIWALVIPDTAIAIQLAGLSALLFSIAGLGLLHWYIKARQLSMVWLVLIYGVIFVLSAWVLPLLAVIAIFDSQLDLRKRLQRGSK